MKKGKKSDKIHPCEPSKSALKRIYAQFELDPNNPESVKKMEALTEQMKRHGLSLT